MVSSESALLSRFTSPREFISSWRDGYANPPRGRHWRHVISASVDMMKVCHSPALGDSSMTARNLPSSTADADDSTRAFMTDSHITTIYPTDPGLGLVLRLTPPRSLIFISISSSPFPPPKLLLLLLLLLMFAPLLELGEPRFRGATSLNASSSLSRRLQSRMRCRWSFSLERVGSPSSIEVVRVPTEWCRSEAHSYLKNITSTVLITPCSMSASPRASESTLTIASTNLTSLRRVGPSLMTLGTLDCDRVVRSSASWLLR
mmetsp:Transcript_11708/g.15457  ORF Transcript_11708/g.15457 Transcript_11708/m.15457 type:complete len:261 (-) Transcript_11708:195-977(-)